MNQFIITQLTHVSKKTKMCDKDFGKKHNNIRIKGSQAPIPPIELIHRYALDKDSAHLVSSTRKIIKDIIYGLDGRLIVIIGPCSIHEPKAALEYARRLCVLKRKLAQDLLIVMRVYFEKPRTTVGWKGLIYDPDLDESFDMDKGLNIARRLLRDITSLGMPTAMEYLDLITPQYFSDLITWGAIGARTTESQTHRELASGLSCPVGFKNGTSGNINIAIDAVISAAYPHMFWSISKKGRLKRYQTLGNKNCHIILRGGTKTNYHKEDITLTCQKLKEATLPERLMIDCSHGNSQKEFKNQLHVADDIIAQLKVGSNKILGVMIESHLKEGRQDIAPIDKLEYGKSITDSCLGWQDSEILLIELAKANRVRLEQ